MVEDKVDWSAYFDHIKPVCPWSTAAWKKDQIKITKWSGQVLDLEDNQAIVYVVTGANRRRLKKLCKKVDTDLRYDWLWSEPSHGPYASPVPVLIQQNSRHLFEARYKVGYYDNIIKEQSNDQGNTE